MARRKRKFVLKKFAKLSKFKNNSNMARRKRSHLKIFVFGILASSLIGEKSVLVIIVKIWPTYFMGGVRWPLLLSWTNVYLQKEARAFSTIVSSAWKFVIGLLRKWLKGKGENARKCVGKEKRSSYLTHLWVIYRHLVPFSGYHPRVLCNMPTQKAIFVPKLNG